MNKNVKVNSYKQIRASKIENEKKEKTIIYYEIAKKD